MAPKKQKETKKKLSNRRTRAKKKLKKRKVVIKHNRKPKKKKVKAPVTPPKKSAWDIVKGWFTPTKAATPTKPRRKTKEAQAGLAAFKAMFEQAKAVSGERSIGVHVKYSVVKTGEEVTQTITGTSSIEALIERAEKGEIALTPY